MHYIDVRKSVKVRMEIKNEEKSIYTENDFVSMGPIPDSISQCARIANEK